VQDDRRFGLFVGLFVGLTHRKNRDKFEQRHSASLVG
jgi:hypothetical protein